VPTGRKQRGHFRSLPNCRGGANTEIKAWSFGSSWQNNNFVSPKGRYWDNYRKNNRIPLRKPTPISEDLCIKEGEGGRRSRRRRQ